MKTDLSPGDVIDGFRIVRLLGQGASSEVVLAVDGDDRQVVLKLPRDAAIAAPSTFDRFRRELDIAGRLDHPGIQRSIDYRTARSRPYLVMEYVEGETLADLLARQKPLALDRAIDFAAQLARAMAHAHDHGVVHRDLKPQNVLVVDGERLVVTDFGIALLAGARRLTWQWFGASLGTPDYMSPEQVQGKRGDARSDIFSIGVLLFEMLAGRTPWRSHDTMDVVNERLTATVPALREFGVDVPPGVEGIVRRCLRKQPDERYPDAVALLHDLEHWRELEPSRLVFADERPLAPAESHLVLLVAGIVFGFLAFSTVFVTAAYLFGHR
jgi:eukaryotic-like serine/threonine-protein kinase